MGKVEFEPRFLHCQILRFTASESVTCQVFSLETIWQYAPTAQKGLTRSFDLLGKFLGICSYDINRMVNKDLSTRIFIVVSLILLEKKHRPYTSTVEVHLGHLKYVYLKHGISYSYRICYWKKQLERHTHKAIHCSTICNSKRLETSTLSLCRGLVDWTINTYIMVTISH